MDYDKLMDEARKQNVEFDAIDRKSPFASPHERSPKVHLITAMAAIECGIKTDDWSCVAEGQAMLEQLDERMKGEPYENLT